MVLYLINMDEFPYANVADPRMSEPYSIGLVTTRGTQPYQLLVHKRTATFAAVLQGLGFKPDQHQQL